MATQTAIANKLGITQAAVSMALGNHPRVSKEMRARVQAAAKELGYRPNPHVSTLMTRIRQGRSPQNHGCIGILVDETSVDAWLQWSPETYSSNYDGYRKAAAAHGFRTECFCLRAPDTSLAAIDRKLRARGIIGLILASPRHAHIWPELSINWENYACAAVSLTWVDMRVDRVAAHHMHNMTTAFNALIALGCRRIGYCQPTPSLVHRIPSLWMAGYLMSQWELPDLPKLEPFVGTIHDTTDAAFRAWFRRWKPDALITAIGDEAPRLADMGVSCSRQGKKGTQLVCLNRPKNSPFPGIDENNELIGRKAAEVVVNQLIHNQCGLPAHPNEILVPGTWIGAPAGPGVFRRGSPPDRSAL